MVLHTLPFSLHFTCFDLTLNYGKFPSFPFPTFFFLLLFSSMRLFWTRAQSNNFFFSFPLLLFYLLLYYMYFFACFLSDTEPSLDFCCTDKPRRSRTPPHTVARTTNVLCRASRRSAFTHLSYYTLLSDAPLKLRQLAELLRLSLRETRLSPVHTHTKPGTSLRAS